MQQPNNCAQGKTEVVTGWSSSQPLPGRTGAKRESIDRSRKMMKLHIGLLIEFSYISQLQYLMFPLSQFNIGFCIFSMCHSGHSDKNCPSLTSKTSDWIRFRCLGEPRYSVKPLVTQLGIILSRKSCPDAWDTGSKNGDSTGFRRKAMESPFFGSRPAVSVRPLFLHSGPLVLHGGSVL